jgi:hypothetical protein
VWLFFFTYDILAVGTIMDNIGYGKDNATKEELVSAAKMANAHDFIMELENGYDTRLGNVYPYPLSPNPYFQPLPPNPYPLSPTPCLLPLENGYDTRIHQINC